MPAEIVSSTVPVFSNTGSKLHDFGNQLVLGHCSKIVIHVRHLNIPDI